ncbi:MAG: DUF4233 domain-containing protein [Tessaracoccus sp.]|uniref:DUF4233 domain-containing protein n=1 Tax=Tessaracoccus sp. TaxID=1971211 RepID=UPI001ED3B214|nr:DUF4233 domain-containing protein [Tessaracoccus sp.]MBK7820855.1 DUF4233 domain-containing protein [Tessaracoccus sp.]
MTLAPGNPMRGAAMSVLIFEVIVIWLGYIGMIQIADVPMRTGAIWCGIATVLCLVACGGLRKRWGYTVGWLAQVAIVALGVLTPWMYAMGLIFALIWVTCIVLGRRIENKQQEGGAQ